MPDRPLPWRRRLPPEVVALIDDLMRQANAAPMGSKERARLGRRVHYLMTTGAEPPDKRTSRRES